MSPDKPSVILVTNVYSPAIGGISTYVRVLRDNLAKRGFGVQVVSYPYHMIQREDRMAGKFGHRIVHELALMAFTIFCLAKILALRLRGERVIVHSHSASFCLRVGVVSRLFGARSVHTFHSPIERCSLRLKALIPLAGTLVCVSEEHRNQYIARCGIPRESAVVPSGADCTFFAPVSDQEKSRMRDEMMRELDLDASPRPMVLFVGRIVEEKGVRVLLRAAKSMSEESIDATFILVGPLDQTRKYAEDSESLRRGVGPDMHFYLVGPRDHEWLRRAYNAADVLAFPSLWEEASGTVVVEAMASGIPVVASRIGGLVSRVQDGSTGYLTKPGDANELARALIDILRNPGKGIEMGKRARELAVEKYSLDVIMDKYEEIYREALRL